MKDFLLAMVAVILAATPKSAVTRIDMFFLQITQSTLCESFQGIKSFRTKRLKSNLPNFTSPLSDRSMFAPCSKTMSTWAAELPNWFRTQVSIMSYTVSVTSGPVETLTTGAPVSQLFDSHSVAGDWLALWLHPAGRAGETGSAHCVERSKDNRSNPDLLW